MGMPLSQMVKIVCIEFFKDNFGYLVGLRVTDSTGQRSPKIGSFRKGQGAWLSPLQITDKVVIIRVNGKKNTFRQI
jgi:hypothetical protein